MTTAIVAVAAKSRAGENQGDGKQLRRKMAVKARVTFISPRVTFISPRVTFISPRVTFISPASPLFLPAREYWSSRASTLICTAIAPASSPTRPASWDG
jgi:hypothetical protein